MDDLDKLKEVAQKSFEKISESATFLGICSENYVKDPVCLIQFSLSILMDKPLFLLIAKGVKPSKKLIRLLDGYEFYEARDLGSFEQASIKLLEKIKNRVDIE